MKADFRLKSGYLFICMTHVYLHKLERGVIEKANLQYRINLTGWTANWKASAFESIVLHYIGMFI